MLEDRQTMVNGTQYFAIGASSTLFDTIICKPTTHILMPRVYSIRMGRSYTGPPYLTSGITRLR